MIDSLLLAAARIGTFEHDRGLTNASGFFFLRDEKLFLVTSRHVLIDEPSQHHPNRIEIELHTDAADLGKSTGLSMLLFADGKSCWRQGRDAAGEIDVAVIELDRSALPAGALFSAFTPAHLVGADPAQAGHAGVEVGSSLLIVGFPLGFHDTLHHLPVVRQAVLASAYGLRFQGEGFFLTDARTHRGTSGAPVVMRDTSAGADRRLALEAAGRALRPAGHEDARPGAGRVAGPERGVVRRHPDDAHSSGHGSQTRRRCASQGQRSGLIERRARASVSVSLGVGTANACPCRPGSRRATESTPCRRLRISTRPCAATTAGLPPWASRSGWAPSRPSPTAAHRRPSG